LGLSDEEFGALTPGLFDALLQRKKLADKAEYLRAGNIASAVINFSVGHPEEPVTPEMFLPKHLQENAGKPGIDLTKAKSPEEVAKALKSMMSKKKYNRRS
jgi:hypothetical protein